MNRLFLDRKLLALPAQRSTTNILAGSTWLRQARLLVCVVAVNVIAGGLWLNPVSAIGAGRTHIVSMTEFCVAICPESIVVAHLSPNVEPVFNGTLSSGLKRRVFNCVATQSHFSPGRNYILPLKSFVNNREVVQESVVTEYFIQKPTDISRRQMAHIFEKNATRIEWAFDKFFNAHRSYAHIGALNNTRV